MRRNCPIWCKFTTVSFFRPAEFIAFLKYSLHHAAGNLNNKISLLETSKGSAIFEIKKWCLMSFLEVLLVQVLTIINVNRPVLQARNYYTVVKMISVFRSMCGDHSSITKTELNVKDDRFDDKTLDKEKKDRLSMSYARISPSVSFSMIL